MRDAVLDLWRSPWVRVLVGLAALLALVLLVVRMQTVAGIFLGAFALAYLANPVVVYLQARGVRRALGVLSVFALLVGFVVLVSRIVGGAVRQVVTLDADGPALRASLQAYLETLPERLERVVPVATAFLTPDRLEALQDVLENVVAASLPRLEALGGGVVAALTGTVTGVFYLAVALVVGAYLLHDFPKVARTLLDVVPVPYQAAVHRLARSLDEAVGGFVRGQVVIALTVGLLVWLGLTLLGLPLAGFIGFLAGFLNVVPFLGTIVPIVPAVLLAIEGGWLAVAGVLLVFLVTNQIDNHLLTPMILSRSTRLHPATVILAVLAGFALLGLLGAILAVPGAVFVKVVYLEHYRESRWYREG
jgi:predicted PurR-regulated permease PerM